MAYVKNGFLIADATDGYNHAININHIRLISPRNSGCAIYFTYHDNAEYLCMEEPYKEIKRALGLGEVKSLTVEEMKSHFDKMMLENARQLQESYEIISKATRLD